MNLAKKFGVKKYPFIVCVEEDEGQEAGFKIKEVFTGEVKREQITKWIESLIEVAPKKTTKTKTSKTQQTRTTKNTKTQTTTKTQRQTNNIKKKRKAEL